MAETTWFCYARRRGVENAADYNHVNCLCYRHTTEWSKDSENEFTYHSNEYYCPPCLCHCTRSGKRKEIATGVVHDDGGYCTGWSCSPFHCFCDPPTDGEPSPCCCLCFPGLFCYNCGINTHRSAEKDAPVWKFKDVTGCCAACFWTFPERHVATIGLCSLCIGKDKHLREAYCMCAPVYKEATIPRTVPGPVVVLAQPTPLVMGSAPPIAPAV